MLVTVSAIVYPLLEQNDRDFAQSKGFRAVPENQTLTDVLEQQEAGPLIRERITNRRSHEVIANENGPRLWFRGPARWGGMVRGWDWQSGNPARRSPPPSSVGSSSRSKNGLVARFNQFERI
jgi:hypothetical protein